MKFEEVVGKVGFGLAVVICQEKLPPTFWSSLSFDQWVEVWKASPLYSNLQRRAFDKMSEPETTFEQLFGVLEMASLDSSLEKTILVEMSRRATSFDQRLKVWKIAMPCLDIDINNLRETAFAEMSKQAIV